MRNWCTDSRFVTTNGPSKIYFRYQLSNKNDYSIYDDLRAIYRHQPDQAKREAIVNTYLNQVGFQIVQLSDRTFQVKEVNTEEEGNTSAAIDMFGDG